MLLLDLLYDVLFHPEVAFALLLAHNNESPERPTETACWLVAFLLVVVVSALGVLYSPWTHLTPWILPQLIMASIMGLFAWVFTGLVFALASFVFGARTWFKDVLLLTAYALLPWVFLPVLGLFRIAFSGGLGHFIMTLGSMCLWAWSSCLFLLAIRYTYKLTTERVLLIGSLPILMAFLGLSWIGGFFYNMVRFLSS